MGKNSRPTIGKREKERARLQKRLDKEARRSEAKERRANAPPKAEGEDPDIAWIVPGPQPAPLDSDPEEDSSD